MTVSDLDCAPTRGDIFGAGGVKVDTVEKVIYFEGSVGAFYDACPVGVLYVVAWNLPGGVSYGAFDRVLGGVESELLENVVPLAV